MKFDYKNNRSFVKSDIYEKHKDYQLKLAIS
jgi:hypothetical protein